MSPQQLPQDKKWLALALLALAQFVVVLDASIVNVALPSIGADLDFSQDNLSWVVNSYTLFFGGFLVDSPVPFMGNVYGTSIAMVHYTLPFMVLTLIPVVQTIDPLLEEAAAGLGASFTTTARRVVLPLALPGIVAGSLLVFAMTIGAFVIPRMIGGTTMHLMSLLIDQQMLTVFNYAIGATLASILLLLVIGIVTVANLVLQRGSYPR